jgi:hypothetical protein
MTTKTRLQLVNKAIQKLQVVGSGQEAEDDDLGLIDDAFDTLVDQLAADSICEIADEDEIPGEWFDALAELLANSCAAEFGVEFNPVKKEFFEKRLRRVTASLPTYESTESEYY